MELAYEALRLETQALRSRLYWNLENPPASYVAGAEVEIEFLFPRQRDAVGFCSPAFGRCSLHLREDDGELYYQGGPSLNEDCSRECVIRRFQEAYFGTGRPHRFKAPTTSQGETTRDAPRYFDPSRFGVRRAPTEEERTPFDASITLTLTLESLTGPPLQPGAPPPSNYSMLRSMAIRDARGLLSERCGDVAIVSVPSYTARDRSIYVHYGYPNGECGIEGAIYSYYAGDWKYSLALYPRKATGKSVLARIQPILMERITVTATSPSDPK